MNDTDKLNLSNVLNNKYGFDLILVLLKKSGAFERGLNRSANDKEIFMTLGKREIGVWLLDQIFLADKEKYIEILTEIKKEKNL